MLARAVAVAALAGIFASCEDVLAAYGGEQQQKQPVELSVSLRTPEAAKEKGSGWVSVCAEGAWTLGFEDPVPDWAKLSVGEGTGKKSNITLSWTANDGLEVRRCTLVVSEGEKQAKAVFAQKGLTLESDPVPAWMELPATDDESLYFFTLPMEIDGKQYRNYSFYWDVKALVAHWVAYPLNSTLLKGSSGRSDAWGGMFPRLDAKYQPRLNSAYSGGKWARGHQLPSADRQILQYNKETFYGVNMTPQDYNFNSGAWLNCETFVRDASRKVDTLYVVTGCVVSPSYGTTTDNDGKTVTCPSAYFKALLAYKKNLSYGRSTGGYTGIAFHFPNGGFTGAYTTAAITIDKLEEITGMDFFVNLPGAIGQTRADEVESTVESWWFE